MVRTYQVGGAVRDRFLEIPSNDIDFAVECDSWEEMLEYVQATCSKLFLIKPEFLTIRALHPTLGPVDYVMCRSDGAYSDGRHPDKVVPGSIFDDLSRRDFKCNAIAIDEQDNIIDPYNGRMDIESHFLSCVGYTEHRFNEDALRILRAMRFSITKDLILSVDIRQVFYNSYYWIPKLQSVSQDRIRSELLKCFSFSTPKTLAFLRSIPQAWSEALFSNGLWLKPTTEQ